MKARYVVKSYTSNLLERPHFRLVVRDITQSLAVNPASPQRTWDFTNVYHFELSFEDHDNTLAKVMVKRFDISQEPSQIKYKNKLAAKIDQAWTFDRIYDQGTHLHFLFENHR